MKIQIKHLNAYDDTVQHHTMTIPEGHDDKIDAAVIKLLTHSWALHPGDSIKIVEA